MWLLGSPETNEVLEEEPVDHRDDDQPRMRRWIATIDDTKPVTALGLAAVLSAANPNLLVAVAGAAAIAGTGIPGQHHRLHRTRRLSLRHRRPVRNSIAADGGGPG